MVSDLCAATTLVAVALWRTHERDPEQLGHWLDFAVLLILGFVVEFRRFEPAWPAHLGAFNRIILFDAGLYGFMIVRQLSHVGFDLRPRFSDWKNGIRELVLYAPIAVPIGLALGFLHLHAEWPGIARVVGSFVSIFFVTAILEETYVRGWRQNLLERRYGRPEHCWLRLSYSDCRTSTRVQLAVRLLGYIGRHLLRQGMAIGTPDFRFSFHPCLRRHNMATVVVLNV